MDVCVCVCCVCVYLSIYLPHLTIYLSIDQSVCLPVLKRFKKLPSLLLDDILFMTCSNQYKKINHETLYMAAAMSALHLFSSPSLTN